MFNEFKAFVARGNVFDMAVGIAVGAAFTKIVSSLVSDIVMPPISFLMGNIDLSDYQFVLKEAADGAESIAIKYGSFATYVIDFFIVSLVIFLLIKQIHRLKRKEAAKVTSKKCPFCCSDIAVEASRCSACTSTLTQQS